MVQRKLSRFLAASMVLNLFALLALAAAIHSPSYLLGTRQYLKSVLKGDRVEGPVTEALPLIQELATERGIPVTDAARHFVHSNSKHREETEYHRLALEIKNRFIVLNDILAYSAGEGAPPDLSCGPRSWILAELYEALGLDWRLVTVFYDRSGTRYTSHTFVEVKNPLSKRWEIQDATGDVVYTNEKGKRLSALEVVRHKPSEVNSENLGGGKQACSWYRENSDFQALVINYLGSHRRRNIAFVNDDFFDLEGEASELAESPQNSRLIDFFSNAIIVEY